MTREVSRQSSPRRALRTRGLTHTFDDFLALAPLSLSVSGGEVVALVGPNGAGKSTFLAIAAGLMEPSGGTVEVEGARAGELSARAATSYLPDAPVFYEDLSLNEHLDYVAALHGVAEGRDRSAALLESFGLREWGESLPSEFSRGMRQKASIALAMVRPFSVLLADEPFDGLDAPSRQALATMLRERRDAGAAIVLATHNPEVIATADRCVALDEGRLVFDGPSPPDGVVDPSSGNGRDP